MRLVHAPYPIIALYANRSTVKMRILQHSTAGCSGSGRTSPSPSFCNNKTCVRARNQAYNTTWSRDVRNIAQFCIAEAEVAIEVGKDVTEQQEAAESAAAQHERETEREAERKAELSAELLDMEVARRRNFAIISHPDAGKTTLVCLSVWHPVLFLRACPGIIPVAGPFHLSCEYAHPRAIMACLELYLGFWPLLNNLKDI